MFCREMKDGLYYKVKARLLLGGDMLRDKFIGKFEEVSSRTISMTALFTMFAIAAREDMDTYTMDFMNAFLYACLEGKDWCYEKSLCSKGKN